MVLPILRYVVLHQTILTSLLVALSFANGRNLFVFPIINTHHFGIYNFKKSIFFFMNKLLIIQQEMIIVKRRIDIKLVLKSPNHLYRFDNNSMTHFSLDNIFTF